MTDARSFLEIRGLTKTYHAAPVIDRIDCEVARGEVVMLIGPSGAGKSTLLRCVNRIEEPSAGSVLIEGVDMAGEWRDGRLLRDGAKATARKRRAFGMVFQRFNLFAHLSALDNVAIGPRKVLGWDRAKAEETAVRLLARVRLADHVHKRPHQLSGGQQQRVAIARALAMQPKVMLFDEPTSALDPELVGEVLDVIRDLAREGLTMLIVTHEMRFAREVGDRIVFMADGRIVEQGAAEKMFAAPETNRLQEFLSRTRG